MRVAPVNPSDVVLADDSAGNKGMLYS